LNSDRLDEIVALLARLNIDVACLICGPNAALGVITCEQMQAHRGSENDLLAREYRRQLG
jgi:hypothetical protein